MPSKLRSNFVNKDARSLFLGRMHAAPVSAKLIIMRVKTVKSFYRLTLVKPISKRLIIIVLACKDPMKLNKHNRLIKIHSNFAEIKSITLNL